jgi:hypothetical protein
MATRLLVIDDGASDVPHVPLFHSSVLFFLEKKCLKFFKKGENEKVRRLISSIWCIVSLNQWMPHILIN